MTLQTTKSVAPCDFHGSKPSVSGFAAPRIQTAKDFLAGAPEEC